MSSQLCSKAGRFFIRLKVDGYEVLESRHFDTPEEALEWSRAWSLAQ